ncbi:hypothetical protein [Paraburkholderia sp. J67]|uniref:hypothetical protein n=1 Tax=Paraburkholderia sp. J67 TaxID=2805435 RepID=UPI002ABE51F5|nr:hypothetical protein [Paraburkholderia sp. J67]
MKKITAKFGTACLLPLSIAMTACSFDPVKKESELSYVNEVVAGTPEKVMRSLQDRQRRCGSLIGAITANGSYMPDEAEQVLDMQVHMSNLGPLGVGRLRMSATEGGTMVRVGVPPKDIGGSAQKKISALAADPSLPCDY